MAIDKFKLINFLWDSTFALPHFLHTLYLFRRHKDLEGVLGKIVSIDKGVKQSLKPERERRLARVSNWLTKLLMPQTEGRCLLRSLLLYRLLKRIGHKPIFLSGVRRNNGKLESHAWVELDGRCLDGTGDNLVRHTYTVNVSSENFED